MSVFLQPHEKWWRALLASLQCEHWCRTLNKRRELRRVLHEAHPCSRSGCVVANWATGQLTQLDMKPRVFACSQRVWDAEEACAVL